jgi:hypothetical protein
VFSPDLLAFGRRVHALLGAQQGLRTLNPHQDATVATIAELIIPATNTPGARAARVNEFIDLILTEWLSDEERQRFLDGLADVDARSQAACGKNFVECSEREQVILLTALDAELTRLRESRKPVQHHFFHMMKRFTLHGYFTSEVGTPANQRHIFVDMYQPCAPLEDAPKDS